MKKSMLSALCLSLFVAASAWAAPGAQPKAKAAKTFEQRKQKQLAHMAQNQQISQARQSCVQAASNSAALQACKRQAKQARRAAKRH